MKSSFILTDVIIPYISLSLYLWLEFFRSCHSVYFGNTSLYAVVIFIVTGGVLPSCAGFKLCTHGQGLIRSLYTLCTVIKDMSVFILKYSTSIATSVVTFHIANFHTLPVQWKSHISIMVNWLTPRFHTVLFYVHNYGRTPLVFNARMDRNATSCGREANFLHRLIFTHKKCLNSVVLHSSIGSYFVYAN